VALDVVSAMRGMVAARRLVRRSMGRATMNMLNYDTTAEITIRTDLKPGDVGSVVRMHGVIYAREYGFDSTFEAYVAAPLAKFVQSPAANERIWLAERGDSLVGCVAIVAQSPMVAQLRWFLIDPSCRGMGLGKRLLADAVDFCRRCGYRSVILWTITGLPAAAHLYHAAGFRKVEEKPRSRLWGVEVVEERHELQLRTEN
jgi:N-acetylglutamate synthase-like GNAT family acetyltransferase